MGKPKMRVLYVAVVLSLAVTLLHADELQDLSSADVNPAVQESASESKGNDLGEGTGSFSGALMTSGSFTVMAAGGGFGSGEEEELGEGTGSFSGALMTSGSFTMMAAGGGFGSRI